MNWVNVLIAMLPENILLAGIVVADRPRDRRRAGTQRAAGVASSR